MLDMAFFNQPWTASQYREGMELAVSGTVGIYRGRLQVQKQEVEVLRDGTDTVHTGRITPAHPSTEGITTRAIRELVWRSLERLPAIADPLPEDLVAGEGLSSYDRALRSIHFPASDA